MTILRKLKEQVRRVGMNTEYIDIYIDGVKLPTPSKIDVEYADMDADSIRQFQMEY